MESNILADSVSSSTLVTILLVLIIICAIVWLFSRRRS